MDNFRMESNAAGNAGTMAVARAQSSFINRVYGWMCGGLVLTALIAMWVSCGGVSYEWDIELELKLEQQWVH